MYAKFHNDRLRNGWDITLCENTDKQTHKHTNTQTDMGITIPRPPPMGGEVITILQKKIICIMHNKPFRSHAIQTQWMSLSLPSHTMWYLYPIAFVKCMHMFIIGVAGRQSIDYATSPTTLYSVLFCCLCLLLCTLWKINHYHPGLSHTLQWSKLAWLYWCWKYEILSFS